MLTSVAEHYELIRQGAVTVGGVRYGDVRALAGITTTIRAGAITGLVVSFLVLPLALVFVEALRGGLAAFIAAVSEADALAAVKLTLLVTAIVVPLNLVFGVAAAWAVRARR